MKYALIKNGIVQNVIEADVDFVTRIADEWDHIEPLDTPHEQGLGVGIGWGYDAATGIFTDPIPPAEPVAALAARHITRRAFWNRFPASKEAVLRAVRLGAPAGALMLVGMLDRLNSRVDASPYVNLDDEQAIEGVRWLASDQAPDFVPLDGQRYALRLTNEEADAILLPDPVGAEVYGG